MFSGTLSKDYEYHINQNSSKLIVSLTQHLNSTVRAIFFLFQFITGILITIFIISFLLFIDPKISSIAFLIFGTYYALIATFFKKKLKNNSKIIADINQKQVRIVRESIGGIRDIILDNNKKFYEEKYKVNDKKMRIKQAINELITAFPRYSLEGIALVTISFLGVFFYLQSKSSSIAILGGIAFGAQKLLPSLQTIYGSWARIKNYNSDILEVENALKNLKKSIIIKPKEINTQFENFKVISLLNISYKYKNSSKYCLKNVSLQIEKGQFIGFIGKTGSGKSTLVDLLMGLLKPSGGEIYIDKKLINNKYQDYYSNLLQRCISHVPQEVFLRNESILSNIVNSQYSKKDLNLALKVSKVKDFVSKLDDGLETIVGERGVKLSGGQKQRIGIARALVRNKQILVLDESTSALDEITEKMILSNR